MKINAREARRRFSELLDRAERGEDVVIERRGHPPVRLVSAANESRPRFPDLGAFNARMQLADMDYLAHSHAAQVSLAENYVGLPF